MDGSDEDQPLFSAVSSFPRQLFTLLRCINLGPKAQVQISEEGLRFSVQDSSVMEGHSFLDKSLFTSYRYRAPPDTESSASSQDSSIPLFEIALPALLETLQILSLNTDNPINARPWSVAARAGTVDPGATNNAFTSTTLGLPTLTHLTYTATGDPLNITIADPASNLTTTCALTTYEPADADDIPFARDALVLKIIMRASWLADAVAELAQAGAETCVFRARYDRTRATSGSNRSTAHGRFTLAADGPLGAAEVEFGEAAVESDDGRPQQTAATGGGVLETFQLAPGLRDPDGGGGGSWAYRFPLIRQAARAMAVASKVSVRVDGQGVLSLQFMIEVEGGKVSFVDFRFVPMAEGEGHGSGAGREGSEDGSAGEEGQNEGTENDSTEDEA